MVKSTQHSLIAAIEHNQTGDAESPAPKKEASTIVQTRLSSTDWKGESMGVEEYVLSRGRAVFLRRKTHGKTASQI